MAFMAAVGGIISGVASAAGGAMQASAANQQAKTEREIAKFNADREREKAAYEQSRGAQESRNKGREYDNAASKAQASMAENGVSTSTGTPLLLQTQFAADKRFAMDMAMFDAKVAQKDRMNKAAITEYEGETRARAAEQQGKAAMLSGFAGAVGSIGGAMKGFG